VKVITCDRCDRSVNSVRETQIERDVIYDDLYLCEECFDEVWKFANKARYKENKRK
jgi:hypothetical protein